MIPARNILEDVVAGLRTHVLFGRVEMVASKVVHSEHSSSCEELTLIHNVPEDFGAHDRTAIVPPPCERRLLAPSCWRLLRALLIERDRDEARRLLENPATSWARDEGWYEVPLAELARRARLTYAAARWALARLRRSGLVATRRTKDRYWVELPQGSMKRRQWSKKNALAEHEYVTLGRIVGSDVRVPVATWTRYVDQVRAHGRAVARLPQPCPVEWWPTREEWIETAAEMPPEPVPVSPPQTRLSFGRFSSRARNLHPQPSRSITEGFNTLPTRKEISSSARRAETPIGVINSFCREPKESSTIDPLSFDLSPDEVPCGPLVFSNRCTPDPRHLIFTKGPAPYRMPDENERPVDTSYTCIPSNSSPVGKVLRVINAFRTAVRLVYDQSWKNYLRGEITPQTKNFAQFLEFANELDKHDMPPEKWAVWRLRWFRANVAQWSTRPPLVLMIMSAKALRAKGGWCRTEMAQEFAPVFRADPILIEQDRRNREANNLWRCGKPFVGMDRDYVKKRRAEMQRGFLDPLDDAVWPRPVRVSSRYTAAVAAHQAGTLDPAVWSRNTPLPKKLADEWLADLWGTK